MVADILGRELSLNNPETGEPKRFSVVGFRYDSRQSAVSSALQQYVLVAAGYLALRVVDNRKSGADPLSFGAGIVVALIAFRCDMYVYQVCTFRRVSAQIIKSTRT